MKSLIAADIIFAPKATYEICVACCVVALLSSHTNVKDEVEQRIEGSETNLPLHVDH